MNVFAPMIDRGHETVCFHQDRDSGLRSIIAVHSTVLGPGFGGARRWHYRDDAAALHDVLRLSEGMTYKAAAANIPIGGGKAVVLLPERGFPATETEARALGRFVDSLGGLYVSAEDVGLTPEYVDWMAQETPYVSGASTTGGDPSPFTARGVVNAMRAALAHLGRAADFAGLTVAIQGVGHVGAGVARILAAEGARLIVADIDAAAVSRIADEIGATPCNPDEILSAECDILAPCALGGVIDAQVIPQLRAPIVCGGANNILGDYDEDGLALKARGILYVPDFIANAGGMIELAGIYLGMPDHLRAARIDDIESTTRQVLADAESESSTYAAAVALARRRIEGHAKEQIHAD